ncbi:hypothetical protein HOD20_05615 [archaeon]|jgi:predicted CopG family antitoxin|nr:hypothetical protein [archaeon]MBT4351981.1 hypothetical protein [archaeon]MBT4647728.1 hypothetical protein [archaeon]MBT6821256.1 hypothetical protein [archaeon]
MATKTITITEDAYEILKNLKTNKDSFSDVIKKNLGKSSLKEIYGLLKDSDIDKRVEYARNKMDEDFRDRMKRNFSK